MDVLLADFAGEQREFRLRFGDFIDLEEACKVGMGVLYQRLATTSYAALDIKHILTRGLVGAGMKVSEADRIVMDQLNSKPLMELASLASDVIIQAMTGIKPDENASDKDPDEPIDAGKVFASLVKVGITPDQVREMRYSDYVQLMRSLAGSNVQPPTEEEFAKMLREFEAREVKDDD